MRDRLSQLLVSWGHEVAATFGPSGAYEAVDYPDIAQALANALLTSEVPALGMLVCGTGQGMAIAANKIPGIRAGVVADAFSARMIREHNNANVICLGERVLGPELAASALESFVGAEFAGGRHLRRVSKIVDLEGGTAT